MGDGDADDLSYINRSEFPVHLREMYHVVSLLLDYHEKVETRVAARRRNAMTAKVGNVTCESELEFVPMGLGISAGHLCTSNCYIPVPMKRGLIEGVEYVYVCVTAMIPHLCGEERCTAYVRNSGGSLATCPFTTLSWQYHDPAPEYEDRNNDPERKRQISRRQAILEADIAAERKAHEVKLAADEKALRAHFLGDGTTGADDRDLALLELLRSNLPEEAKRAIPRPSVLVDGEDDLGPTTEMDNNSTHAVKSTRVQKTAKSINVKNSSSVLHETTTARQIAQSVQKKTKLMNQEAEKKVRNNAAELKRKRVAEKEREAKLRKPLPRRNEVRKQLMLVSDKQNKRHESLFEIQKGRLPRDLTQNRKDPHHGIAEINMIIEKVFNAPYPEHEHVHLTAKERLYLHNKCKEMWRVVITSGVYSLEQNRFDMISTFLYVILYAMRTGANHALFQCDVQQWCLCSRADISRPAELLGLNYKLSTHITSIKQLLVEGDEIAAASAKAAAAADKESRVGIEPPKKRRRQSEQQQSNVAAAAGASAADPSISQSDHISVADGGVGGAGDATIGPPLSGIILTAEEKERIDFLSTRAPWGETIAEIAESFANRMEDPATSMPEVYPLFSSARLYPPSRELFEW